MSFFESLLLGIIQGLTEFFPISSSAHLKLTSFIFKNDLSQDFQLFSLFCHSGTLLASLIFLRHEILNIFKNEKDKIFLIFLAIFPLIPFYFFLKPLREFLSENKFLPLFLFITSIFLFITANLKITKKQDLSYKRKIKDMLLIGTMQALALIPGISRSGFTISSAYLRGWKIQEAIKFSFLLAIPSILGGNFLEIFKYLKTSQTFQIPIFSYLTGFLTSFTVGLFAIRYIFSITSHKKFNPFAWYLLILAILSFTYLNFIK